MEKIRLLKLIKDSIVAGILIGFGCITNVSCNNPVVGAFLFSLGLFAVIIQGRYLFTGKVGYCGNEEITGKNYELVLGLFANLISVWLLCFLFAKFTIYSKFSFFSNCFPIKIFSTFIFSNKYIKPPQ